MMRSVVLTLRWAAVAIAVAGAVDPACVTSRASRPLVALVDADAADLGGELARRLSRDYDVHRGAIAGAAATVVAGDALPPDPPAVSGALIAVAPVRPARHMTPVTVVGPVDARPGSVAPIDIAFRTVGFAGRTVRVELQDITAPGAPVLVDRHDRAVTSDGDVRVRLSAPVTGTAGVRLAVRVSDRADASTAVTASLVVDVTARRWRVVMLDGRPSWPATFVRRALEADARFDVATRVATSRGRAALTGDASDLSSADVVVVGAPEALDAVTARALERLARERGVAIVLLADVMDVVPSLAGGGRVREVTGVERRKAADHRGTLVGTAFASPVTLPSGSMSLAALPDGATVVWQAPLGAGRVVVNGALDAWRYRDRDDQGFTAFWRAVIAEAAAAVPPPISVWPDARLSAPGAPLTVRVVVPEAQLSDPLAPSPAVAASAWFVGGAAGEVPGSLGGSSPRAIRLWPTIERGVFAGVVGGPGVPLAAGRYRIHADLKSRVGDRAVRAQATATIVIADDAPRAPGSLASWAASRGGVAVTGVDAVVAELARRVHAVPSTPSRVMRAVWWLPVFLLLVGAEWWIRRYYGLTP